MSHSETEKLVDHLFRHQAGKMVSVLSHLFGLQHLQLAEDVVQDAFVKAQQSWKYNHLPDDPAAWLMQTAKNKAIDLLRRENHLKKYRLHIGIEEGNSIDPIDHYFSEKEIKDSQLRMIFACCHPLLKQEDQIALTLKTVSGFSIHEIARSLLTNDATVQKRLSRAKEFLRSNEIKLEIPAGEALKQRLQIVHTVLYLLFNEGYNSLKADELIRRDLCGEAMRCTKLLTEHSATKHPASFALLALMCFHAARFDSRIDDRNEIILLEKQDRSKWNKDLVSVGYHYLNLSSSGDVLSVYHIESAIAAEHCSAASFKDTNWQRLFKLYDLLYSIKPTPVVQLNKSIVLAQTGDVTTAIKNILNIEGIDRLLLTDHIYSSVLGELYKRLSNTIKAKEYLEQAYQLTPSEAEKKLLQTKILEMMVQRN